ncbi:uncharacterized protein LOC136021506 isoform X2 [Lathamus discolor]|uniref:uncharacterized protein LOC136021506 isoform X2 n=1 Tax=Lathamus discolor TaxID=678569 RepID=UPI0032B78A1F
MQELVAGVEIGLDLEAGVEQQRGAQPLPFLGECSNKDCSFLHVDASTVGCPWYDRGFCRQGPLCKYKHRRRVMCANYLVGFCPEGPNCTFMHLKAGLRMNSTDPSKVMQRCLFSCISTHQGDAELPLPHTSWQLLSPKLLQLPHSLQGAGCPWGLVQLDLAASKETGCKDVLPMEPPLPVTGATQHPAVQPWDTNSCSPGTQTLPEQGTGLKRRQKGHGSSNCGKTQLEILLGK